MVKKRLKYIILPLLLVGLLATPVLGAEWPALEALRESAIPNVQGYNSKGLVNAEVEVVIWVVFDGYYEWELFLLNWGMKKGMVLYEVDGMITLDVFTDLEFIPSEVNGFDYGGQAQMGIVPADQQVMRSLLTRDFKDLTKSPLSATEAAKLAAQAMFAIVI